MDFESLPQLLQKRLQEELEPDEKVVWLVRPAPKLFMRLCSRNLKYASVVMLFLCSLFLWMAYWTEKRTTLEAASFFAIFLGVIALAIYGLSMSLRTASETWLYVITDRRAIVFFGKGGSVPDLVKNSISFVPDELDDINVTWHRGEDAGDITLGWYRDHDGSTELGFWGIWNLSHTLKLLNALRRSVLPTHKPTAAENADAQEDPARPDEP